MNLIQLYLSENQNYYSIENASNIEMEILGRFLTSDVRFNSVSSFKEFVLYDHEEYACSNATALEKEDNDIFISFLYSQEKVPTQLKISRDQFIKLLDDWEQKVCKIKPKEVLIIQENDQFFVEIVN